MVLIPSKEICRNFRGCFHQRVSTQNLPPSSQVWEDKSVVTAAVTSCGWALRYASEALQNDQVPTAEGVEKCKLQTWMTLRCHRTYFMKFPSIHRYFREGTMFFFPKFVWMIRLDIFWSWGHPLSWERWPKRFIFVISIGETQEPIASNLYIEPPKKLDLPIFGWKICNFYILYVYKYLKRYKYISYICIQIYLWHARKNDTNISISICI